MLADLVRALHIAFFLFVVWGFIALVVGVLEKRPWVRNPWFRFTHLSAVALVLFEDFFRLPCPLNVLEDHLKGGEEVAQGSDSFLNFLLHHTVSERALDVLYWGMGAALVLALIFLPPDLRQTRNTNRT